MRTIWVVFHLFISVLCCSLPIILLGWFDKNKNFVSRICKFWSRWMLWSTGITYNVFGLDLIDKEKQYVFMCNHTSALDILFGVASIPNNIVFLAKKELFSIPLFGLAMKAAGMIKIDRQNSQIARKSVNDAIKSLFKTRLSTLIYPEGTRSQNSQLKEFKKGGFILAIQNQCPIVPMSIIGAGTSLPKGSINIKSNAVNIVFSRPISTKKINPNNYTGKS